MQPGLLSSHTDLFELLAELGGEVRIMPSTRSGAKSSSKGPEPLVRVVSSSVAAGSIQNLILERNTFRIVFLEPYVSSILASKDLKVTEVPNFFAGVDVNPNCHCTLGLFVVTECRLSRLENDLIAPST
jgi:hypothetical protein